MVVKKLKFGSSDGVIDVHYTDKKGDVRRLASWDLPAKDLKTALRDLMDDVGKFCNVTCSGLKAVTWKRDINDVVITVEFTAVATNSRDFVCKSPEFEYSFDLDKDEIKTWNDTPIELVENSKTLELELEAYINGKRSQQEIPFPEPVAVN